MDFLSFLKFLYIPFAGLNWIDLFVFTIIIFYSIEGYALGFFAAFIDLLSFILSFLIGLSFYGFVAMYLVKYLSISHGFANAIGFFAVAVVLEICLNYVLGSIFPKKPIFSKANKKQEFLKNLNKFGGIIPGVLSGLLLVSFILSLVMALPFSVFLKHSVSNSRLGNVLVANTQGFTKDWNNIFGGAVNDSLSFLTVEPKSNDIVSLNFKTTDVSIDYESEQKMLNMVNYERTSSGFSKLTLSDSLAAVARDHCKDMFAKGYFSHYTPEGASPFDRMSKASIDFSYAGENLALAPNVDLAMQGLMQSPGHKANILSTNFGQVGIGVIDGGIYGEMFCQEFTN